MGLGWVVPDTPGEEAGLPVLGEKSQGEADTRKCQKSGVRNVPGGPVAKTPCSQCKRLRFDNCSGN